MAFLTLAPGVTVRHILAFYWCTFMTILAYTFVNAAQPTLLRDIVHVESEQRGRRSGNMNFYGELVIILSITWFGVISDKIGRRPVYVFGMAMMALGLLVSPLATDYLTAVAFRLMFALGASAAAAMMTAVLSDYVTHEDKAKASGLMGLVSGLGAVTAAVGLLNIPKWLGPDVDSTRAVTVMYGVAAGVLCVAALGSSLLAGKGEVQIANSHVGIHRLLLQGLQAAVDDPLLVLAYFAGFVARGDSIVLTLWMSQWVNDFSIADGLSPASATAKAGMVTGIAQTCALLCAPFCGLLAHRAGFVSGLAVVGLGAVVGYVGIAFITDPTSPLGLFFACIIGFGEIGVVVISQGFVSQRAPKNIRGAVGGTFGLFGSFGILTGTKVGGLLYDSVGHSGPFGLFAAFTAVVALGSCIALCTNRGDRQGSEALLASRNSSEEEETA